MPRSPPPSSTLGRLLEAAGYRLETRLEATVAVRSRDHRALVIVSSARSPAEIEGWFPPDSVHRCIVYDDEPGSVARAIAADRGIEVLDPSTLGSALGEILLPSPTDDDERSFESTGVSGIDAPLAIALPSERTVHPRIAREEAEVLAGADASRYILRLVPFYVAAYHVRPPSPHGGAARVVRHLVAVNAVSRRPEVWESEDRELVAEIEEPHERLAPQMTLGEARPLAVEAIRRHHTVHVDHTEQHGGALVIEARRIAPSAEDVRVGPFVLLYVPFWYAEGVDGRVVLNAVSGRRAGTDDAGTF